MTTPARALVAEGGGRRLLVALAGLLAVTALLYARTWNAGFIWNDSDYVTAPALRSWRGLARIWFEVGATEQYYPMLHSAFWLQHRLWGDAATGYHLANLAAHAASAVMLVAVLRRLAVPGALLAGCVFAVHPVSVESVAWISEQKNTLSLFLYLAAAWSYLGAAESGRIRNYLTASLLFGAALLTKSVTATLPAALLVMVWWRRGRIEFRRDVRPLLPWFAAAVAFGLFSAWVEYHHLRAQGADFALGAAGRLALSGWIVSFYAGKVLWPSHLVFIYPRWSIDPSTPSAWLPLVAVLAVLGLLWALRHRTRAPLAAGLFFIGSLFPTLGFFNVYAFRYSYVADHWQYLPQIGLIALGCAALASWNGRVGRWVGVAMLVPIALLAWRSTAGYRDLETFYRTLLRDNPSAWLAHNNLGTHLVATGRIDAAIPYFLTTLRLRPHHPEARANLGGALLKLGRFDEAAPHLAAALASDELRAQPGYVDLLLAQGHLLLRTGRPADALTCAEAALVRRPESAEAHNFRGIALRQLNRTAEAVEALAAAVRANPQLAEAHFNRGEALAALERWAESAAAYDAGLRIRPGETSARRALAAVLYRGGRPAEAVGEFARLVESHPDDPDLRTGLAVALAAAGRRDEALHQTEEGLRRTPGHAALRQVGEELRRSGGTK